MLLYFWIDLAQLDSKLTKCEVNSNGDVSHFTFAFGEPKGSNGRKPSCIKKVFRVRHLSSKFLNDQGFTSLGVFAKFFVGAMRFCLV